MDIVNIFFSELNNAHISRWGLLNTNEAAESGLAVWVLHGSLLHSLLERDNFQTKIFYKVVWHRVQGMVGSLIITLSKYTRESEAENRFEDRLWFDRVVTRVVAAVYLLAWPTSSMRPDEDWHRKSFLKFTLYDYTCTGGLVAPRSGRLVMPIFHCG